jgi:hypothetical protein
MPITIAKKETGKNCNLFVEFIITPNLCLPIYYADQGACALKYFNQPRLFICNLLEAVLCENETDRKRLARR